MKIKEHFNLLALHLASLENRSLGQLKTCLLFNASCSLPAFKTKCSFPALVTTFSFPRLATFAPFVSGSHRPFNLP